MSITAIILTYNEEKHIKRCIESLRALHAQVLVADSYSSDRTVDIAESAGARVIQNRWTNHASQFNWALGELDPGADWILRIDADEVLSDELAIEINSKLSQIDERVSGIYVNRRIVFQGRPVRHGGVGSIPVLRLFRYGKGRCERRWMDEHIKVDGATRCFDGCLVDENLNSLTWWVEKHNHYASREAVDLLNIEYRFSSVDSVAGIQAGGVVSFKRWLKEHVYARMPAGFRAWAYFLYRYIVRLGFLDRGAARTFHYLQAFWYRYLVDAKVNEVKRLVREERVDIKVAIERALGIQV